MSVLRPETCAVLRNARAMRPLFSNMIAAELFDAAHTRGDLTILPTTDGHYVVFDKMAPNGRGVRARCATIAEAHAELERLAKTSGNGRLIPAHLSPAEASEGPALTSGVDGRKPCSADAMPDPEPSEAARVPEDSRHSPRARAEPNGKRRRVTPREAQRAFDSLGGGEAKVNRKGVGT